MIKSIANWVPTAVYMIVSSIIVVALDNRVDFASGVVLLITTVQIALLGFFFPFHPYRRAKR